MKRFTVKTIRKVCTLIFLQIFIFLFAIISYGQTCAVPGADGIGLLNGVVNTYYPSPATATASGTSIPVGAVTNLESNLTPISAGDLLLIVQIQNANINDANTSNYGAGNGTGRGFTGGTAGFYEYAIAFNSVPLSGGTAIVTSPLTRNYISNSATASNRGKQTYQVIRVPQYSSATIAGTVSAAAWNGTSGGVVAFDVAGTLTMSGGTISAAGKGFRGGGGRNLTGASGGSNTDYRSQSTVDHHASKGEGIVGTPRYVYNGSILIDTGVEGYPSGSYARGAPGNAGGGGTDGSPSNNTENSGGGGGGNGGVGGVGGNSWSSNLAIGGIGGAAFSAAANRVLLGGGGGAGTNNNKSAETASGGAGGGIVMVRAGAMTGAGYVNVNGAAAPDSKPDCCGDGAGGGGAGGSIILIANSGLSGITASANGGKGGNTLVATDKHGPGGGGGGGVILSNGALSAASTAGGANGTTSSSSPYGAESGGTGSVNNSISASSVNGTSQGAACLPNLTVAKSTSTPALTMTSAGDTATYKITVSNAANRGTATALTISDALPQPIANAFTYATTTSVTLAGGASRSPVNSPTAGAANPGWGTFYIPGGGSVEIIFTTAVAANTPSGTYQNPATATYLDPVRTTATGTATASYNSSSTTNEDVTVANRANLTLVKICRDNANADCNTTTNTSYTIIPGSDLNYRINFTNIGGLAAQSIIFVDGVPTNTDFKIGTATMSPPAGMIFVIEYSNDYTSANPLAATWSYTPTSGGGGAATGYDRNVKAVRWRATAGTISAAEIGYFGFTAMIR